MSVVKLKGKPGFLHCHLNKGKPRYISVWNHSLLSTPVNIYGALFMALTKNDIVEKIQNQLGFLKFQSKEITEILLKIIKSAMESGDDVLVSGFGKFCVRKKAERRGRNPATGEDAILPARRVVTFKCSGKLREKVNGE